MRQKTLIVLLLGSPLLAACRGSSPAPPLLDNSGGRPPEPPPTATLTVTDPSGAVGPFAIVDLERLVLNLDGGNLSVGAHPVRIDVTSPGGTLYAQIPATLVANDQHQGRATSALQVRGSVIEGFSEAGTWQLVANVDGAPLASASVDLTE